MNGDIRRIAPEERIEGLATAGMTREEAVATDRTWAGLVRAEPRSASGWHHHGDYETTIYVVEGSLRLEFGPGGSRSVEAGPGDFLFVPPGAIHRESNPSDQEARAVVVRAGSGVPVVNVDGPA